MCLTAYGFESYSPRVAYEISRDETELLAALRRGEPKAFEQLVKIHQDRVYGLCLRMMSSRSEAEDLAQEVFITVFKSIDKFRSESRLSTWIYRITRNHCLNRIKFLKRRAAGKKIPLDTAKNMGWGAQTTVDPVASRVHRPDRLVEGRQMEEIIQEQIASLSEDHRELVVLRDLEHLSYEEIQEITGLARGTIKSRLHRARMDLAKRMAPYLSEE